MAKEKFKSTLREKFKARAAKADGRSLSVAYKELKGKHKEVSVPKSKRQQQLDKVTSTIKEAGKKRAHEILGGKLKKGVEGTHKSLTGIRHPAQLIPAFRAGRTLKDIIKRLTDK